MDATHVVDPKLRLLRVTATYNACIFATMVGPEPRPCCTPEHRALPIFHIIPSADL
jgi:hypothetical protein